MVLGIIFLFVTPKQQNREHKSTEYSHRRNLREYEGYRYHTFWTDGYRTPSFQDEKVKNLLSSAVNRGDLRILNYNKTVFGRAPPWIQLRGLTTLIQTQSRMRSE